MAVAAVHERFRSPSKWAVRELPVVYHGVLSLRSVIPGYHAARQLARTHLHVIEEARQRQREESTLASSTRALMQSVRGAIMAESARGGGMLHGVAEEGDVSGVGTPPQTPGSTISRATGDDDRDLLARRTLCRVLVGRSGWCHTGCSVPCQARRRICCGACQSPTRGTHTSRPATVVSMQQSKRLQTRLKAAVALSKSERLAHVAQLSDRTSPVPASPPLTSSYRTRSASEPRVETAIIPGAVSAPAESVDRQGAGVRPQSSRKVGKAAVQGDADAGAGALHRAPTVAESAGTPSFVAASEAASKRRGAGAHGESGGQPGASRATRPPSVEATARAAAAADATAPVAESPSPLPAGPAAKLQSARPVKRVMMAHLRVPSASSPPSPAGTPTPRTRLIRKGFAGTKLEERRKAFAAERSVSKRRLRMIQLQKAGDGSIVRVRFTLLHCHCPSRTLTRMCVDVALTVRWRRPVD